MLKNKKLWFLITIFTVLLSFNCFAADDDAEPDWDAVSLSEGSTVLNKARQQAARRSTNLDLMQRNLMGSAIPYGSGDASKNNVNIQGAYLFTDELIYPFSTFNNSKMASNWRDQLYILVKMKNEVKHAKWDCKETETKHDKVGSCTHECDDEDCDHECDTENADIITETTEHQECNAPPWAPVINTSFGRRFTCTLANNVRYSANSCTYADVTGFGGDYGSLLIYGVYWSPKAKIEVGEDGNDLISITGGLNEYYMDVRANPLSTRIHLNKKLLTEVKQYGSGS